MREAKGRELSREAVVHLLKNIFDDVELKKKWGSVSITFQNGTFRTIEKKETIMTDI